MTQCRRQTRSLDDGSACACGGRPQEISHGNPQRLNSKGLLSAAVSAALLASVPAVAEDSGRSFEIYGFAQADYIQDIGGRLDPDWDDAFRPSKICFDGACGEDGQASISVKQSRFGVKGTMPTGSTTAPLSFKFEFDLFGTGVDAGQTTMRLRHFYGEWGQILAGQTNSLFMDIDVFPNTIDYWGPSGMVFYRNVQIRWTPYKTDNSHFAIAIERPSNDIDSGNLRLIEGLEDVDVRNDEELPDLTAQFRYGGDWGHLQLGGILRKVGYELRRIRRTAGPKAARWVGASTSARCSTCSRRTRSACRSCTAKVSRAT